MTTAAPPAETAARLDMHQMAQFVMDGFIEFDDLVPEDLNAAVHEEQLRAPTDARWEPKIPDAFLDTSPATQAVLELPRFKAVLASLLGPSYIHDHSYLHITPAGQRSAQSWHVDHDRAGRRLTRDDFYRFNILIAYFTHDVPREMGPTLILPGSHLRQVGHDIARYRNIAGQKHLSGPGGRIAFIHDAVWHCAQPNLTDRPRFMFKVRYHPAEPQRGHFDATGWDSLDMWRLFRDNVNRHAWQGSASDRVAALRDDWWRYLCGAEAENVAA